MDRQSLNITETLAVGFDEGVPGALYRICVGFITLMGVERLHGRWESDWTLVPALLFVLVLLRAVPLVLRKMLPFSKQVKDIWAQRRQTAKRYDSYQWQKMFWIGLGIALAMFISHDMKNVHLVVAAICLLGGCAGLLRWGLVTHPRSNMAGLAGKATRTIA